MRNTLFFSTLFLILFNVTETFAQDDPWVAPESAKEIENTVAEKKRAASAKKGAKIFSTRCVLCHGENAKGDGPAGARLNPKPADLTSERVQSQVDGEIFWKISNGRGVMPQWEALLSEEERWNLVNYINTLAE